MTKKTKKWVWVGFMRKWWDTKGIMISLIDSTFGISEKKETRWDKKIRITIDEL